MEVSVNHQNFSIPDSCSVQALLGDVLRKPNRGIAIAINEIIVSKTHWETHYLNPGDQIMIIKATQGG